MVVCGAAINNTKVWFFDKSRELYLIFSSASRLRRLAEENTFVDGVSIKGCKTALYRSSVRRKKSQRRAAVGATLA